MKTDYNNKFLLLNFESLNKFIDLMESSNDIIGYMFLYDCKLYGLSLKEDSDNGSKYIFSQDIDYASFYNDIFGETPNESDNLLISMSSVSGVYSKDEMISNLKSLFSKNDIVCLYMLDKNGKKKYFENDNRFTNYIIDKKNEVYINNLISDECTLYKPVKIIMMLYLMFMILFALCLFFSLIDIEYFSFIYIIGFAFCFLRFIKNIKPIKLNAKKIINGNKMVDFNDIVSISLKIKNNGSSPLCIKLKNGKKIKRTFNPIDIRDINIERLHYICIANPNIDLKIENS